MEFCKRTRVTSTRTHTTQTHTVMARNLFTRMGNDGPGTASYSPTINITEEPKVIKIVGGSVAMYLAIIPGILTSFDWSWRIPCQIVCGCAFMYLAHQSTCINRTGTLQRVKILLCAAVGLSALFLWENEMLHGGIATLIIVAAYAFSVLGKGMTIHWPGGPASAIIMIGSILVIGTIKISQFVWHTIGWWSLLLPVSIILCYEWFRSAEDGTALKDSSHEDEPQQ